MKTAIFIDGANIYAAARALEFDVDYDRLIPFFNKDKSLLRAYYYTALLPVPDGHDTLRPLCDFLEYNGYSLVTKMAKTFTDRMGMTKIKGNMDMELAVDAMLMTDHVDNIVLFSGDGDFTYLVRALQQKGCRVTVVSTLCTNIEHSPMVADELRRAADLFIDLQDIKEGIQRAPSADRPRRIPSRS